MNRTERRLLLGFAFFALLSLTFSTALAAAVFVSGGGVEFAWQPDEGIVRDMPTVMDEAQAPSSKAEAAVEAEAESASDRATEPGASVTVLDQRAQAELEAARERERARARPARQPLPLPPSSVSAAADLSALYEQASPGVVSLDVRREVENPFGGEDGLQQGSGSGFVYDERHIVTNNHVVQAADEVEVVFFDGQRRLGTVIGTDVFSDLAVVELDDMPDSARALPLTRDFGTLSVGQPVVAIGNPFGLANTMTSGIISALGRTIPDGQTRYNIPQTVQTDAAINPGNSGGPLIDLRGQVIGVNAQITTNNRSLNGPPGNSGVGFAIPSSIVARVVPSLIERGEYQWSFMGVMGLSELSVEMAEQNGLSDTRGAYITAVPSDGPAADVLEGADNVDPGTGRITSGNMPIGGDVIIAVDGQPVDSFDDLLTYVALETVPGQQVELTVLRDGQPVEVTLTMGARER